MLFRLTHGEPSLLDVVTDPDVHRLVAMNKDMRRDVHKMHASVRFRAVGADGDTAYIAWFEPRHYIVERAVELFVRRFASLRWSVLTPKASAHWDGQALVLGAGVTRGEAPSGDSLEELWRTYYAHIFNPARVAVQTMRAVMPMRYWHNLPEASLVPALTRDAPARVRQMLALDLPAQPLPEELAADDLAPDPDAACTHAAVVSARSALSSSRDGDDCRESQTLFQAGYHPVHDAGALTARHRAEHVRTLLQSPRAQNGLFVHGVALRVGTASWTDPTMLQRGVFYPDSVTTAEQRLRFYASKYSLVEVDSTYYVPPVRSTATACAQRTPKSFLFHVKAFSLMTGHAAEVKRMPDWLRRLLPRSSVGNARVGADELPAATLDEVWRRFIDALQPLRDEDKLGPILLQFPRWFRPSRSNADRLRTAREHLGDLPAAVEFRNADWVSGRLLSRTLSLWERLQLTDVIVDAPSGTSSSMPPITPITTPSLAVVRLHGRRTSAWEARNAVVSERYRYLYDRPELDEWATRIDQISSRMATAVGTFPDMAKARQGVHVVVNNCHANYGTTNADEITALLIELDKERLQTRE